MTESSQDPNITLMTYSEVEEVSGYIGNFTAKIRKKARYVDPEVCNACEECAKVCPVVVPDEFRQYDYQTMGLDLLGSVETLAQLDGKRLAPGQAHATTLDRAAPPYGDTPDPAHDSRRTPGSWRGSGPKRAQLSYNVANVQDIAAATRS